MIGIIFEKIPSFIYLLGESFDKTNSQFETIIKHLDASFPDVSEVKIEVTYEEVIDWFINQPRHPKSRRGAVLRRSFSDNKIAIIQLFLDEFNEVIEDFEGKIHGRKLICSSIDDELAETFDHNNLIVIH